MVIIRFIVLLHFIWFAMQVGYLKWLYDWYSLDSEVNTRNLISLHFQKDQNEELLIIH